VTRCGCILEDITPAIIGLVKMEGTLVFVSWKFVRGCCVAMAGVGWSTGVDVKGGSGDYRIVVCTQLCWGCRLRAMPDIVVAGVRIGCVDECVTGAGWARYW